MVSRRRSEGSGTAVTIADEASTSEPYAIESKTNVAPAPTLSAEPLGRAPSLTSSSVPASTYVPPA